MTPSAAGSVQVHCARPAVRVTEPYALSVLLATATKAVHHRCITGTAFGGFRRNRGRTRNGTVEPDLPLRRWLARRIRLTGLLRKPLQMQGFLFEDASPVASRI